jgi:hypothetical protein
MKERLSKLTLTAILAIAMAFTFNACGEDDSPKSLAKQNVNLIKEYSKPNYDAKALSDKQKELESKIGQLSPEDKKIYIEEQQKLMEKMMKK